MEFKRDYEGELVAYLGARKLCIETVNVYKTQLGQFLNFCYSEGVLPEDMPSIGLVKFLSLAGSESSSGQRRAMLVNLYEFVFGQGYKLMSLPYAKKRIKIPESLSPEQIQAILLSINNPKQRLILKIMYACGLRVSEAVKIHINDFHPKKNIRTGEDYFELKIIGKGIKERAVAVPNETMNEIINFVRENKTTEYLFKGQFKSFYSARSVQIIFNRAKIKCGITIEGSSHLLRKSRVTHLINGNMNDRNVMLMMGWENKKTIDHYHRASTSAMKDGMDDIDERIKKSINSPIQNKSNTILSLRSICEK